MTYYVLSQSSDNKYKVITEELTHKYKALKRGEKPGRGKQRDFAAVTAVGLSMYAVFHGPPHRVIKCKANPYNLVCSHCPGYDHDGICSHVLAISHIIMSKKPRAEQEHLCNLEYLCEEIAGAKKKQIMKGAGNTRAKMPKALEKPKEKQKKEMTVKVKMEGKWLALHAHPP